MSQAWAFNSRNDITRTGKSVRVTEAITSTFGADFAVKTAVHYAKITELIEGESKVGKGKAVKWDDDTKDWIDDDDGLIYDHETLVAGGPDVTIFYTSNITSPSDLSVDQIVRLQFYPGLSDESQWLVLETGSAADAILLNILSFDEETGIYTADILDNPTDRIATVEGVNVKPLEVASNFDALLGQVLFSPQSYTEDIPEDEQEEPTEEEPDPPTTRRVYYVNPPILY